MGKEEEEEGDCGGSDIDAIRGDTNASAVLKFDKGRRGGETCSLDCCFLSFDLNKILRLFFFLSGLRTGSRFGETEELDEVGEVASNSSSLESIWERERARRDVVVL